MFDNLRISFAIPKVFQSNDHSKNPNLNSVVKDLFLVSAWGLTAGLCIGSALNSRTYLLSRLTPSLLLFNWVVFPFLPSNSFFSNPQSIYCRIAKIALIITISNLGIVFPVLGTHYIFPMNLDVYSDTLKSAVLVQQITLVVINALICKENQSKMNTERHLDPLQIIKRACLSGWFSVRQIIQSSNRSTQRGNDMDHSYGKDEDCIRRTKLLAEQNSKSASYYKRLCEFIQNDKELKRSFSVAMKTTQHQLLPFPNKEEYPSVPDQVLDNLRKEMQIANYWTEVAESLRDFLEKNEEFTKLLHSKFVNSDIQDKNAILSHYGLN